MTKLKQEATLRYQTGFDNSDTKSNWIITIKNNRQLLGDEDVERACIMLQKMAENIDKALDNAYMAGILASNEDVNPEEPQCDRKPIPVYESVMFNKTQIADCKKPRILQRAINLLDNALQVYKEYDSIRYDPEQDKEYMAIEYWLPDDDDEAYETIESFREKLERSQTLGIEKENTTEGETKRLWEPFPSLPT